MFNCLGTPLVISMPHYYGADPEILTHFDSGINPNKADHAVFIHFESVMFSMRNVEINSILFWFFQITGTPLSGAKRLQMSLDVEALPEIDCMQRLPTTLMPLFWVEESVHLNKTYTNLLKYQLFL